MSTPDHKPSSRRSPYQKFSDGVFSKTGLPVSRLVIIIIGLLFLGWAVLYATRRDDTAAEFNSKKSEKQEFLAAITLPDNFSDASLPVQIDKLDWMIERCDDLLTQKGEYSDRLQERVLALNALKVMTMADNGMDPALALEAFEEKFDQISGSSTEKNKHQYLAVSTYLQVLAADPDSGYYNQAIDAISAIQETTPIPMKKAHNSFVSAVTYFEDCKDKAEASKLVRLLGERMGMAKNETVSSFGFSLQDLPNFFSCYRELVGQAKLESTLESETIQLLKQIEKTPPQSAQTYSVLMKVPEKHLLAGKKQVALRVVENLISVASSGVPRIRDAVLPTLQRQKARIDLLDSPFPFSGSDMAKRTIGLPQEEQTLIIFFNPSRSRSKDAVLRVANSPLREGWTTKTYLVSVAELTADQVQYLRKMDSNFTVVDGPTSKDWIEKCGIENVPYLIRLDSAGVVERVSIP